MPVLRWRSGAGRDEVRPLEGAIFIGRGRENHLVLEGEGVSDVHCAIRGLMLRDLESEKGTFVNGERVRERELAPGDVVEIGGHKLEVVAEEAPSVWDRNVGLLLSTILSAVDAEDPDRFLEQALRNVAAIADAERAMSFSWTGGAWVLGALVKASASAPEAEQCSRSVLERIRTTGAPVYVLDRGDSSFSPSMQRLELRSVMAVPVKVGAGLLGAIYVDSRASRREFAETDLKLFEAVVNTVALAWNGARVASERRVVDQVERRRLEFENTSLRRSLGKRAQVVGKSPAMQAAYQALVKAAPTDAAVLVLGETGTGKEALARSLHELSPRASGPFVIVDCTSIPETLLEPELFGYEKGAFTGAVASRPGQLEVAGDGTLFLDEIGDMAPALQAKLLRALQEKEFRRVGGTDRIRSDFRVVAATNRDLSEMVGGGKFREDLYYRLAVVSVRVPPLRERVEDVLELAEFFVRQAAEAWGMTPKAIAPEAVEAMRRHAWPGNVRELKHKIEQAMIMGAPDRITVDDLALRQVKEIGGTLEAAVAEFERRFVLRALETHQWNVTRAAESLGISRQHVHNHMKKHGIERPGAAARS